MSYRILGFLKCGMTNAINYKYGFVRDSDPKKPGLYFERKSTPYTQTILRTWGAYSRPPMPIYAVVIAQMASINTPRSHTTTFTMNCARLLKLC